MGADKPNLSCPYTGQQMRVLVTGDPPKQLTYSCEGGFDPCQLFESEAQLDRAFRLRNGRPSNVKVLKCAYTGEPIQIVRVGDKFRARGVFTPRALFSEKQELLYAVSTRNGVLPDFPKELDLTVGPTHEEVSDPTEGLGGSEDAVGEGIDMLMHD